MRGPRLSVLGTDAELCTAGRQTTCHHRGNVWGRRGNRGNGSRLFRLGGHSTAPCTPSAFFQGGDVVPALSPGAGAARGADLWRPCLKTRTLPPRDGKLPVQCPAE